MICWIIFLITSSNAMTTVTWWIWRSTRYLGEGILLCWLKGLNLTRKKGFSTWRICPCMTITRTPKVQGEIAYTSAPKKGLLIICSSCKKIRDDEGYWHQVEKYIQDRSAALVSNGTCPDCARKLYPHINLYPDDKWWRRPFNILNLRWEKQVNRYSIHNHWWSGVGGRHKQERKTREGVSWAKQ